MRGILFLSLVVAFSGCRSSNGVVKEHSEKSQVLPANALAELDNIRNVYSDYKSFSASFVIKGKVENAEILYDGTISVSKGLLKIVLKDPVFRSPFFSLSVSSTQVTQTDHMRNKTDRVPLNDYKWVEIFGKVFPFRFFYPILKGFAPDEIYQAKEAVLTESGETRIRHETDTVEFATFSKNGKIDRILFRSKMGAETLLLTFSQESGSKDRHFPKTLIITRPSTADFIRMNFSSVKFKTK